MLFYAFSMLFYAFPMLFYSFSMLPHGFPPLSYTFCFWLCHFHAFMEPSSTYLGKVHALVCFFYTPVCFCMLFLYSAMVSIYSSTILYALSGNFFPQRLRREVLDQRTTISSSFVYFSYTPPCFSYTPLYFCMLFLYSSMLFLYSSILLYAFPILRYAFSILLYTSVCFSYTAPCFFYTPLYFCMLFL